MRVCDCTCMYVCGCVDGRGCRAMQCNMYICTHRLQRRGQGAGEEGEEEEHLFFWLVVFVFVFVG